MRLDRIKFKGLVTLALALALLLGAGAYGLLAASLPRRSGEARVPGLVAPLEVALDARAIPTVRGTTLLDVLRGQGYLHAQERFTQMDLGRRASAGELAALIGERALALDRSQRPFGHRALARQMLEHSVPAEQLAWLDAYTEGVNAGLADLRARPPEYWLLRARPEPWRPEDSLLVMLSFYTSLSNNDSYELGQGVMNAVLPPPVYDFLTPSTSRFDRPLIGATFADPTGGYAPLAVPGREVLDLRDQAALLPNGSPHVTPPLLGPGSNNWAIDASRSAGRRAIVANDPHLTLRLPSTFYRIELEWPDHAMRGVSIPGLPGVLIGASDRVAFGATVSNADQSDWVVVERDPSDPGRYRVPEGFEPFTAVVAEIEVAGRAPERLETELTRWGPVVREDWRGRPLALHAAWREPGGLDLGLLALADARDVTSAIAILTSWSGPSLNWVVADAAGQIGWAVNGPLPRRVGFDGSRPESLADGSRHWQGKLQPPSLVGSPTGVLFTANNRTLPPEQANALSRMWMRPLRAQRIADLLAAQPTLNEHDSLAMQLDTRAEGYEALRAVVLEVVPSDELEPRLKHARELVNAWNGHADIDQPGFRLLQAYYVTLLERALAPLLAPAIAADPAFVYRWPLGDEVLRRLLDERPAHLLTREYANWPAFLRRVLSDTLAAIERDPSRPGIDAPWGAVNALDVRHPFAGLLGPLAPRLALPPVPLPGSTLSLRVTAPSFGAVLRMAVAPSDPRSGVLEMTGGQSGHFLSPQFRDQQADWVDGTATPFLAGPTVSRFALKP